MIPYLVSLRQQYAFLPKDFIETSTGHLLALVHWGIEGGRLLAALRYRRDSGGLLKKLATAEVDQEIARVAPHWLFECPRRNVQLTGVPVQEVVNHFRPEDVWANSHEFLKFSPLLEILKLDPKETGITGSFLVGANSPRSDVDLVVYGAEALHRLRQGIARALKSGEAAPLTAEEWQETYLRRGCTISLKEYYWHERRKLNKFNFRDRRIDTSCVSAPPEFLSQSFRKLGRHTLEATVIDDSMAFSTPAVYEIDHASVHRIVSFTPTYAGQAEVGEHIVASGWLEEGPQQQRQLLIGTSREATGEFLRVKLSQ